MGENVEGEPKMQMAIKLEPTCDKSAQLYNELKFYQLIGEKEGFPNVFWFGQWDKYNVLVMVRFTKKITKYRTKPFSSTLGLVGQEP